MTARTSSATVLHADQEHGGLRAAVIVLMLLGIILGYFLISALLRAITGEAPDYGFVFACGGAILVGVAVAWITEQVMKRVWPSGRRLVLDETGIRASDIGETEQALTWSENLTSIHWFFRLSGYPRGGRERRVPKNWLCLATQLQQDEERLVIYTYMPSGRAAGWTENNHKAAPHFQRIFPVEVYDTSFRARFGPPARPELPARVLTGKHGKYWLAERRRWNEGFELPPREYAIFLDFVQTHQGQ